ncbi:MAG: DUF501 domain-containing protein [Planctomycetota bacterium]
MRQRRHKDLRTEDVVVTEDGTVLVQRCYPLRVVDGQPTPFPTLFWLADEAMVKHISHAERDGWIQRFQARLAEDEDARAALSRETDAYVRERWEMVTEDDRELIRNAGLEREFLERGIGGLSDRAKVKCLHLHYAHHLARGNTIGRWMEEEGLIEPPRLRH